VVATGIDNTGVTQPMRAVESALKEFAGELRYGNRSITERSEWPAPLSQSERT
jgi:hypothetical protein